MPADLPRRTMGLARLVRWLCLICVVALGLAIWLVLRAKTAEAGLVLPTAAEEAWVGLRGWLGFQLALWLAVMAWMQAAITNADRIAPDPARIGPWMSVVWWLVPVVNLFQPVRAMSQTWNTTVDRGDLRGAAAAPVAGWWLLAMVGSIWLALTLPGFVGDPSPEALSTHLVPLAGSFVIWAAALATLASCVKTISHAETAAPAEATAQPA